MVRTQIEARGVRDPRVLEAMRAVPRHRFVEPGHRARAYDDYPLPIAGGQTISQPYIVALMTEALSIRKNDRVLEIGTGSGYQAAVLAEMGAFVYSVERIPALAKQSRALIDELGYRNVMIRVADGTTGWIDQAPFDGIIVTAAGPDIPPPLLAQLADGGRLIAPVGDEFGQELVLVTKSGEQLDRRSLGGVRFVKLIGTYGWKAD